MNVKTEQSAEYQHSAVIDNPATINRKAQEDAIILQAMGIVQSRLERDGYRMTSVDAVKFWIGQQDWPADVEQFGVIFLTKSHSLIGFEKLFSGTIDQAKVYPRELVKACLRTNSAAVILVHNHPSGDVQPSTEDKKLTDNIRDYLSVIEVRVLDHFIVGREVYSFAEHGLL